MRLTKIKPKIKPISTIRTSTPAIKRLTGRAGERMRHMVLKRDGYLCQECWTLGVVSVAAEVDHITPLHKGGTNAIGNQRSLCKACHDIKSEREDKERNG